MKKIYLIDFKAAWCSYFALKGQTQDFDIYSINEMTKQIQKYPFFHSCLLIVEDAWRYLREATQRFQRFPASKYFKSALGASRGVTSGETPSICIQWQELNFMETPRHVTQNTQGAATRMHCKASLIHGQWMGRVKTTASVFMYLNGWKHHQISVGVCYISTF